MDPTLSDDTIFNGLPLYNHSQQSYAARNIFFTLCEKGSLASFVLGHFVKGVLTALCALTECLPRLRNVDLKEWNRS